MPLHNEEESAATLVERVMAAPLPPGRERENVVADEGSASSSVEEAETVVAR
jgi:hypothetical protein